MSTLHKNLLRCTYCLEPASRPGQSFNLNGVCKACQYVESLGNIDWQKRRLELDEIVKWGQRHQTGPYDCIIGVSGGKDSLRQAMFVRDELNMHPLLVCCSYPPEQSTERGALNISNLISKGFDLHFVSPSPKTWKLMQRIGFLNYAQWTRSTELSLYATVLIVAKQQQIPLIFFGENPGLSFGAKSGGDGADANGLRAYDTLGGASLNYWVDAGIPLNKLNWYRFLSDSEIAELRIIYLGYFISDFNDIANTEFAKQNGFIPRSGDDASPLLTGSINPYESVDEDHVHVNQYLKYLKLGFGKVTQQVGVRIRYGIISRDEGKKIIQKYDGLVSEDLIERFCEYLEISKKEFIQIAERHRNHDLWFVNNDGEWVLKNPV